MSTIANTTTTTAAVAVNDLRRRVTGTVHVPGDAGYDDACGAWNLCFRHEPAIVVVAATSGDVVEAVRFAHAFDLRVAVQATGHGVSRPADATGILIITSLLTDVSIDAAAATATVAAGAKWGAVLAPAQEHGLAPLLGSTTDVGAVGYTLGGGMGWLARRHGLCSDSVRSFDLVTPDGTELHLSDDENPELFWALRGGGAGAFGIVLQMEIELYPVTTVYAGNLLYPIEMAGDVVRRHRDWVHGIDEHLTSSVALMNFPPLDIVPEPLRGQSFVMVRGCWSGDVAAGEALIDEWRAWRTPAIDMFGAMPFTMADMISNDPVDPMPGMVTTEWFDALADEAIDVIVEAGTPAAGRPPLLLFAELRHAGGAVRAKAPGTVNEPARTGEFVLELGGLAMSPEMGAAVAALQVATRARLAPYVNGAAYLNFTEGHEKEERTGDAFSAASLARLGAIKAGLDAGERFRHGFAIPAAGR